MAGRMEGKVSFITGAGRGQGRAHAVLQAREGADIIAVDICEDIKSNPYPMAGWDDLVDTKTLVEEAGRRCVAVKADVRDREELRRALNQGIAELGRLTTVMANAGILPLAMGEPEPMDFQDAVDVDLIGVMNTVAVAVPHLIPAGTGASIVITGSTAALIPNTTSSADPRMIMGPGGGGLQLLQADAGHLRPGDGAAPRAERRAGQHRAPDELQHPPDERPGHLSGVPTRPRR